MRTTAGMQEVEQRRSSCRGATLSRLVALAPRPRVNLTRFHGVFAPNSKYRAKITPARRGKRNKCHLTDDVDKTPAEKRAWPRPASRPVPGLTFSMTWAKRLKRVFDIDITTCDKCGADVRIVASIKDPAVIQKILAHLDSTANSAATALLPDCRASPGLPVGLFDWRNIFNHDTDLLFPFW